MGIKPSGGQLQQFDGRLAELQRQFRFQSSGYPHDPELLLGALQLLIEGKFPEMKQKDQPAAFRLIAPVRIGSGGNVCQLEAGVSERCTSDCFVNDEQYCIRDSRLDAMLPRIQPERGPSRFSVFELTTDSVPVAAAFGEFLGGPRDSNHVSVTLYKEECFWTLGEIDRLVTLQIMGKDVGVHASGWGNLFPVLDQSDGIAVVSVHCDPTAGRRWKVYLSPLGEGLKKNSGTRMFFRHR